MRKIFALFGTITLEGIDKVNSQLRAMDKGFGLLSKNMMKSGRQMKTFGMNISKAISLPVAGAGAAVIKFSADFDKAMTTSTAIMGNVSDDMRKRMSDVAKTISQETTFSAKEAAEAFYFLASAGKDAEQSMALIPNVAKFAMAGQFDLARATELLTDAQNALGMVVRDNPMLDATNLKRVSDTLVRATSLADATTEQFAEALTNRAANALRVVNKDVEEGVAVLAAFADQGRKGEEAGTQFGIVMRDLQNKAIHNNDAFKKFNFSVYDQTGKMRNLGDIIGNLETALEGMTDREKKATIMTMGFTDKSVAALLALIGTSDRIKYYEEQLRIAGNTTEEVATKQMNTFWAQLKLIRNQLELVLIDLGENLLPIIVDQFVPAIKDLIYKISSLATKFKNLQPETQRLILIWGGITAVLGPAIIVLGQFIIALGNVRRTILLLNSAMLTNPIFLGTIAFGALAVAIGHVVTEHKNLNTVANGTIKILTKEQVEAAKLTEDYGDLKKAMEVMVKAGYSEEKMYANLMPQINKYISANERLQPLMAFTNKEKVRGVSLWLAEKDATSSQLQTLEDYITELLLIKKLKKEKAEDDKQEADDTIYTDKSLKEQMTWVNKTFNEGLDAIEEGREKRAEKRRQERIKKIKEDAEARAKIAGELFDIQTEYDDKQKEEAEKKWYEKYDFEIDLARQSLQVIGSFMDNRRIKLDNEYKENKQRIEDTITDETQKQEALQALEDKYEKESLELKRKEALANKAEALFNIAINTAVAITKVMGTPWLIGAVSALGAAQAAAVALRPVPLQYGGYTEGSATGVLSMIGERNTKELVLPLETGINKLAIGLTEKLNGINSYGNNNSSAIVTSKGANMNRSLNLNIGTFIGDQRGIKELTRKIIPVINTENQRKAFSY